MPIVFSLNLGVQQIRAWYSGRFVDTSLALVHPSNPNPSIYSHQLKRKYHYTGIETETCATALVDWLHEEACTAGGNQV